VIESQKEAATYCGVSTRTIRSWEQDYTLRDADGRYLIERLDERIAERNEDNSPLRTRILTADAENKEVKTELGRIQLKIRLGELVPRESIEVQRIERVLETRRVLMSLVRKLPPLMKGKTFAEMADTVRSEVYYALGVFAGGPVAATEPLEELKRIYDSLSPTQKKQARTLIGERPVRKKKKS
jgi:transcriptional regulator with XRE-family HTH domain